MKVIVAGLGTILALGCVTGCGSSSSKGGGSGSSSLASSPLPLPSVSMASAIPSSAAQPTPTSAGLGTIDLTPNWAEIKQSLKSGWGATCLNGGTSGGGCTGKDAISDAVVSGTFTNVPGQIEIKMEYEGGIDDGTNTSAQLDLGHFALCFSTAAAPQTVFQEFVTDSMDALPVGTTRTKVYAPLRVTVLHPDTTQWEFTITQS